MRFGLSGRTPDALRSIATTGPAWPLIGRANLESLLETIVSEAQPAVLLDLAELYVRTSRGDRGLYADAIRRIVEAIDAGTLVGLDRWIRSALPFEYYGYQGGLRFHLLHPADLDGFMHIEMIGLCASHADGHVRQAALRLLATSEDPVATRFVLPRCIDWVPQLRAEAQEAARRRIERATGAELLTLVPLARELARSSRDASFNVVALVEDTLRAERHRPTLLGAMAHPDVATRAFALRMAYARALAPATFVLERGRADAQLRIRRWAFEESFATEAGTRSRALFAQAAKDTSSTIRWFAARHAPARPDGDERAQLRLLLADPAPMVRATARATWERLTGQAPIAEYRGLLAERGPRIGILLGLGECGDASDLVRITPSLNDASARRRAAALRSTSLLLGDASISLMLSAYLNDANVVARTAFVFLARKSRSITHHDLLAAMPSTLRGRARALRLARALSKWQRLWCILRIAPDLAMDLPETLRIELRDWQSDFNRSYVSPAPGMIEELGELIERIGARISPEQRRELRFMVGLVV